MDRYQEFSIAADAQAMFDYVIIGRGGDRKVDKFR